MAFILADLLHSVQVESSDNKLIMMPEREFPQSAMGQISRVAVQ